MSRQPKHGKFRTGREGAIHPGPRRRATVPGSSDDYGIRIQRTDVPAVEAFNAVRYDRQTKEYVYTLAPVNGGSGATALMLATVLGGNAPPNVVDPEADPLNTDPDLDEQGYPADAYPVNRLLSLPLPLLNPSDRLLYSPRVKKWEEFDLPSDYAFGDKLPRVTDGLCYLRLERPYAVDDRSWSAYLPTAPIVSAPGQVPYVTEAKTDKDNFSKIRVFWSRPIRVRSLVDRTAWKVIPTGLSQDEPTPQRIVVLGVSYDESLMAVTLLLDRPIDPSVETVELAVKKSAVLSTARPPVKNSEQLVPVTLVADVYSTIYGLNRVSLQGFNAGDLVIVSASPTLIYDETATDDRPAQVRRCYDILHPAGPAVPLHSHAHNGGGGFGGGPAGLSVTGTPWGGG